MCFYLIQIWISSTPFTASHSLRAEKWSHVLFCLHTVQSDTKVTGILGNSLTLKFTFASNVPVKTNSHIVVHQYKTEPQKIAEYTQDNMGDTFDVNPENNSVSWHIATVTVKDSGLYWASVVSKLASKSNKVWVTIQEVNTTGTGKQKVWLIWLD